jgi:hypothetical protein
LPELGKMGFQLLLPVIKGHRTPQHLAVYRTHLMTGISSGDCMPPKQKSLLDIQISTSVQTKKSPRGNRKCGAKSL